MSTPGEGMPRILTVPLQQIAALFHPAPVPDAPLRRERWIVFGILLLAAAVRFWQLGSFSFHKPDEDTTALAAVHILQDGTPRFPSGMFYGRAVLHSYLIGASFAGAVANSGFNSTLGGTGRARPAAAAGSCASLERARTAIT